MEEIDVLLDNREYVKAYELLMNLHETDKEDYNYRIVRCAYYLNKHEEARRAMNKIMFENNWNRDICTVNIRWYTSDIRKYATLINFSNEALSEFSEIAVGDMRKSFFPSNPSIYKHDGGYIVNIRFVTYLIHNGSYIQTSSDNTINTENVLVFYDNNLVETRRLKVNDNREKYYTSIRGIEDIRITSYDEVSGEIGFIGTVVDYQPIYSLVMPRMLIGKIDSRTGNIVSSYLPQIKKENQCEKNWVPIIGDDRYVYMYHNGSMELTVPNSKTFTSMNVSQDLNLSGLRSSTQVIKGKGNKYYTITHEVYSLSLEERNRRRYVHRFLELDEDLKVLRVSSPFKYSDEGIQYIAGLCYDDVNDRFLFTGSVNDREARMYSIPYDNVDKLLSLTI